MPSTFEYHEPDPSARCVALSQVWDNAVPGAKDMDPMAAIPESHPITKPPMPSHRFRGGVTDRQSPTYSMSANCSYSSGTAATTTSDMSHSITQPAADMAAPFMKRIRVTSKPKADISMVSQPTSGRSGQQAVATGGPGAMAAENAASDSAASSNQQTVPPSRTSDGALNPSAALGAADARDTGVQLQQMSHTPLHSFSQTFQHDLALTHGNRCSPVPQRAISEQPSTSSIHLTRADSPGALQP